MQYAITAVRSFTCEQQLCTLAIECGAPFDQLLDGGRSLFDERVNGKSIAKAIARFQGVLFMQFDFVVITKSGSNSALSIFRGRLAETIFRDDENATRRRSSMAARSPATPAPTTMKSVWMR